MFLHRDIYLYRAKVVTIAVCTHCYRVSSYRVTPVCVKNTLLSCEPLPGNPAAEIALQPLIWCSESPSSPCILFSGGVFFHSDRYEVVFLRFCGLWRAILCPGRVQSGTLEITPRPPTSGLPQMDGFCSLLRPRMIASACPDAAYQIPG